MGSKKEGQLTAKQQRFVQEYLIDLNATQAAVRAGYAKGKSAEVQGARLLGNARVAAEIEKGKKKRQKRTEITQDRVLQEFARLAFFDVRKLFDEKGKLKKITELDDDIAAAIAGIDVAQIGGEDGVVITTKFKLPAKLGYLQQLAAHVGVGQGKDDDDPLTDPDPDI